MKIYWSKNDISRLKGLPRLEQVELLKPLMMKPWNHWQVWIAVGAQTLFFIWFVFFGPEFANKFFVTLALIFVSAKLAFLPYNYFLAQYLEAGSAEPK